MCTKCWCDYSIKCCCNKKLKIKRIFFPLFFGILFIFFEEARNVIYLPLITSSCFFVFFWNFPRFVYYTASKPLYYQDIFIDEKKLPNYNVSEKIKNKFECIFIWVLIILNTFLVGGLSELWLFKYKKNNFENIIELIGTTGGLIKIFQIINNIICRIMLKILKIYIKKENIKFKNLQNKKILEIVNLKKKESKIDIYEKQLEIKSDDGVKY